MRLRRYTVLVQLGRDRCEATMATIVEVKAEPLTAGSFAPYGQLIGAGEEPADYARPLLDVWRLDFRADARTRVQIMRYHRQPMTFSRLERHVHVTEGRIPLGRARAALAVAGATGEARDSMPDRDSVRAFRFDGSCGILFAPGIWHSLDCFPLGSPSVDFVLLSDEATETEIESWREPASGRRTHVCDYASVGIEFRIVE